MGMPFEPNQYISMYHAIRIEAVLWPRAQIMESLKRLLCGRYQSEARWGAIDALTDILGKIEPPEPRETPI